MLSTDVQGILRTIPLFKLLPGRPRSSFASFTTFLGGILLCLLAKGLVGVVESGDEHLRKLKRKSLENAEPAAEKFLGDGETKEARRRRRVANVPVATQFQISSRMQRYRI